MLEMQTYYNKFDQLLKVSKDINVSNKSFFSCLFLNIFRISPGLPNDTE